MLTGGGGDGIYLLIEAAVRPRCLLSAHNKGLRVRNSFILAPLAKKMQTPQPRLSQPPSNPVLGS
jgi:hypothetical protein